MTQSKTFIAYKDWIDYTEEMTLEETGLFFKCILDYQNGNEVDPGCIKFVWTKIKKTLDENNESRESEKENKVRGAKMGNLKRWRPDLHKDVKEGRKTLEEAVIEQGVAYGSHTDRTPSHTVAPVAVTVTDTVTVTNTSNITKTNNKQHISPQTKAMHQAELERDFLEAWDLYDKKQDKQKGMQAYTKARKKESHAVIMEGIHTVRKYWKYEQTEKQYMKGFSVWMNGSCWEDEYSFQGKQDIKNSERVHKRDNAAYKRSESVMKDLLSQYKK